jgi:hypothetical protein
MRNGISRRITFPITRFSTSSMARPPVFCVWPIAVSAEFQESAAQKTPMAFSKVKTKAAKRNQFGLPYRVKI